MHFLKNSTLGAGTVWLSKSIFSKIIFIRRIFSSLEIKDIAAFLFNPMVRMDDNSVFAGSLISPRDSLISSSKFTAPSTVKLSNGWREISEIAATTSALDMVIGFSFSALGVWGGGVLLLDRALLESIHIAWETLASSLYFSSSSRRFLFQSFDFIFSMQSFQYFCHIFVICSDSLVVLYFFL